MIKTFSFFFSPLEQFEVYPLISIYLGNIDFSITNHSIIFFIIFFFLSVIILSLLNERNGTLLVVPNRWQSILELVYLYVLKMVFDNIPKKEGQYFFPFIFSIFFLFYV